MVSMCQYSVAAQGPDTGSPRVGTTSTRLQGRRRRREGDRPGRRFNPEGRTSPHKLGLWDDRQRDAFRPIAALIREQGAGTAIQMAHAGPNASTFAVARRWPDRSGRRAAGSRSGRAPSPSTGWPAQDPLLGMARRGPSAVTLVRFSTDLARVVGPLLVGVIIELAGFRTPIAVMARPLALGVSIAVRVVLRESRRPPVPEPSLSGTA